MAGKYETRIQALADIVLADYGNERVIDRLEMFTQPDRQIGHDSVIGSNVFITHPIAPGTRVSIKSQELLYRNGQGYVVQPDVPGDDTAWFYVI